MASKKKFDVFLSHNSKDKPWVVKLKNSLEVLGIKVWLDKDEIRPGDLFAKALEYGIKESKAVALVISPEAMNSGWVEAEYYRALSLATNNQLQLIPVLYKKAEIPGFLSDRSWVDFSNEYEYDEKVRNLVWGITGEKLKIEKSARKPEHKSPKRTTQRPQEITLLVSQIKNPFVRDLERKLRMRNAHWIQAGFSVPASEFNFTLVYYQNQIEVFNKIQVEVQTICNNIADRNVNLLQDTFLDMVQGILGQVSLRVDQVEDLLSSSPGDFELSLTLKKSGSTIIKDISSVKKMIEHAAMTLLSEPMDFDQRADELHTELENLLISIEEYQRHLTAIYNQANLEKIFSQTL